MNIYLYKYICKKTVIKLKGNKMTNETKTFKVGEEYNGRFISDADSVIKMTVVKRTAKTLRIKVYGYTEKTVRVSIYQGAEEVSPFGKYSMSPIIKAI